MPEVDNLTPSGEFACHEEQTGTLPASRPAEDDPMTSVASSPPEQGQLVNFRQRQWAISEVAKGTLAEGPLQLRNDQPQQVGLDGDCPDSICLCR